MALELAPKLIRKVSKKHGTKVQVTAIAEQGKIIVLPSNARLTVANLVQSPETVDQMKVVTRGHCAPLLEGGSVLVFGEIVVGGAEFGTRIVATQVKPAGHDGSVLGMRHADEKCALCVHRVAHAH